MGARSWLYAQPAFAKRAGEAARRKSAARRSLRSFPWTDHFPNLQRHRRSDRLQRTSAEGRRRSREIFEFAGDAVISKGQRTVWVGQDQARIDWSELRDRVRRPA